MKNIFLGLFALILVSPLAVANPCRAMTNNLEDRSSCALEKESSGYVASGDWLIRKATRESGHEYLFAMNSPINYYGSSRKLKSRKSIRFFCYNERTPALIIHLGTELKKESVVSYRFDNDEYIDISDDKVISEPEKDAGNILLNDKEIVASIFTKSIFSVKAKSLSGETIEMVHTLDKGNAMMLGFKCLSYVGVHR